MELRDAFSLSGKRIIVTGAASGMGQAFARLAAGDGARLALLDINPDGLERTQHAISADGQVRDFVADMASWEQVERAVQESVAFLGGLDAVCSFAGWDSPGVFWEQPLELWHKLIGINLWGPLHLSRATVPILLAQGAGRIVYVSSDAGRVGSKGETVYAAAKAGVIGLTKSLARELAPTGIGVNCVCPGPTNTPLLEEEARNNPRLIEKLIKAVPMRRVGEVDDMAYAVAFLASSASSYMTGQVVSVSGGLTMVG